MKPRKEGLMATYVRCPECGHLDYNTNRSICEMCGYQQQEGDSDG